MSTITVQRRAIATVCRGQSSRHVHSSSINQATALSAASLGGLEPEEITIAPIFDIFDAPTRLAESSQFIRDKYKTSSKVASDAPSSSSSVFVAPQPRPLPTSLPAPIVFDGPARPKNGALAFRSRMRQAGVVAPSTARQHHTPPARHFSTSEPLVQVFEGPAKITRYQHHPSGENRQNSTKYLMALGVAGAVGCATLAKNDEQSDS
ncbi:hypothetical protein B0H34DRAFT_800263 [Crassisporium funariophilum]|nr:hypothetical protein B0H34DRAFT_800263 [Crassisporium funariophilum]